jgi:hypothetical protein
MDALGRGAVKVEDEGKAVLGVRTLDAPGSHAEVVTGDKRFAYRSWFGAQINRDLGIHCIQVVSTKE